MSRQNSSTYKSFSVSCMSCPTMPWHGMDEFKPKCRREKQNEKKKRVCGGSVGNRAWWLWIWCASVSDASRKYSLTSLHSAALYNSKFDLSLVHLLLVKDSGLRLASCSCSCLLCVDIFPLCCCIWDSSQQLKRCCAFINFS